MRLALAQFLGGDLEGSAGHDSRVSVLHSVTDTHSIFSQAKIGSSRETRHGLVHPLLVPSAAAVLELLRACRSGPERAGAGNFSP